MYDFLIRREKKNFILNTYDPSKVPENDRGYHNILSSDGFQKVRGIMLADEYHPILNNKKVLEVLNNGKLADGMEYIKAEYKYEIAVSTKE